MRPCLLVRGPKSRALLPGFPIRFRPESYDAQMRVDFRLKSPTRLSTASWTLQTLFGFLGSCKRFWRTNSQARVVIQRGAIVRWGSCFGSCTLFQDAVDTPSDDRGSADALGETGYVFACLTPLSHLGQVVRPADQ